MRKFLLDLAPSEPLALVQELPYFDNSIKLDSLLLCAKERRNVEIKIIVTNNLSDGVRFIIEWEKLLIGPCKAFLLQVKPHFVSHLNFMWHPMLIMELFVLGIGLL
jgi:hypothetical protein